MSKNPFLELRESRGWSQNECARIIGVDVRAIARLEHGLFTSPLPTVVNYWTNHSNQSLPELLTAYEDFVFNTRVSNHRVFGPLYVDLTDGVHPFRVLRTKRHYGLTETVRLMCIPLDTLQYWEKKWRLQKSVPKVVLLSLNQMGYSQTELTKFSDDYVSWRGIHLKDARPALRGKRSLKVLS